MSAQIITWPKPNPRVGYDPKLRDLSKAVKREPTPAWLKAMLPNFGGVK